MCRKSMMLAWHISVDKDGGGALVALEAHITRSAHITPSFAHKESLVRTRLNPISLCRFTSVAIMARHKRGRCVAQALMFRLGLEVSMACDLTTSPCE
jgi:hypothetical protein